MPQAAEGEAGEEGAPYLPPEAVPRRIMDLEKAMMKYAQEYRYEEAAELRNQIRKLRESLIG